MENIVFLYLPVTKLIKYKHTISFYNHLLYYRAFEVFFIQVNRFFLNSTAIVFATFST